MNQLPSLRFLGSALVGAVLLLGCGDTSTDAASASAGQVAPASTATKLSFYAASRIAEQVSFGATPALVSDLSSNGLAAWIDAQMALPLVLIQSPSWVIDFDRNIPLTERRAKEFAIVDFWRRALVAPDQLRARVAWSLFQFVPVNDDPPYGKNENTNLLLRHAFGNYGDFLLELSVNPQMGQYLNNNENRPTSTQCPSCSPNENYARELLQLFSVGVVQLNPDGSVVRDAQGKPKETYSQKDVAELARALTGWTFAASATPLPSTNFVNAGKLMEPERWEPLHDRGAKTILGVSFDAGVSAPDELKKVVSVLMQHPNIAPFVSLRLIQHLVTSNPSPQYLGRVAAVFRNNGQGIAGDMKSVIRAILLDPEARKGDQPGVDSPRFGKIREPVLWFTANLRGLGCKEPLHSQWGPVSPANQNPSAPPSVFSFYQATDRAPGSNLLAPEQKLLSTTELTDRLGSLNWNLIDPNNTSSAANRANCDVASFARAFSESPKAFIDLVSNRWFRGSMPPTLRSNLQALMQGEKSWNTPEEGAIILMQFALSSPYFGVMK